MSVAVYERMTQLVMVQLEQGTVPWHQPWNAPRDGALQNLFTHHQYQGINVLLLAMQRLTSPYWCTFLQAKEHGGSVKKGAHGTPIVKVGRTRYSTDEDDGGETIHRGTFLKYYTVFNLEQLDGIDAPVQDVEPTPDFTPIERCDKLVAAIPNPPEIDAGAAAYYTPALDRVTMPPQT